MVSVWFGVVKWCFGGGLGCFGVVWGVSMNPTETGVVCSGSSQR